MQALRFGCRSISGLGGVAERGLERQAPWALGDVKRQWQINMRLWSAKGLADLLWGTLSRRVWLSATLELQ